MPKKKIEKIEENTNLRVELERLEKKYEALNVVVHDLVKYVIELKSNPLLKSSGGGLT